MNAKGDKVLVAVDGSDHGLEAARYVAETTSFQKMHVVLFHVYSKLPKWYRDLGKKQKADQNVMKEIEALEMRQEEAIQVYMEEAKQVLTGENFSPESIEIKVQPEDVGIARDIIKEAKAGYHAVVIGRKAEGELEGMVLGNVSSKLIEKLDFVPLMVVGKESESKKILVGVDGSEGSEGAVDFVGNTMKLSGAEITLAHVIRGEEAMKAGYHVLSPPEEFIERAKNEMSDGFEKATIHLMTFGFDRDKISSKIITDAGSRAGALYEEAKKSGYGTIVVGRKGLSKVKEFILGRVSQKLIHMAKDRAVWVVN